MYQSNKKETMEDKNSNSTTVFQNEKQSKAKWKSNPRQSSLLMKLFEDELKDLYWAENAVNKAISKMIKNAKSKKLVDALTSHLAETGNQIIRLEQVFESIDKKATAEKCEEMEGLIREAEAKMESCEAGAMCDTVIISGRQKVEQYEITSYRTLCQFAETLGLTEAVSLLEATLKEERAAHEKLSEVAQSINDEAADDDTDATEFKKQII